MNNRKQAAPRQPKQARPASKKIMNKYKLLALDMDGTLLNSKKKISDETARWLTRLSETGVKIALCTGRNIAEIREYDEQLTGVRYAILNSGAILYDTHDFAHPVYTITLDERYVRQALELTRKANGMFHLHTISGSVVDPSYIPRMGEYAMQAYQPMFENVCLHTTDFDSYITEHSYEVLKVCMYHRRPEDRVVSRSILEKEDVQLVYSEKTSLEVSPKGTTKELGLRRLCEYLHISPEETVAVGDAENDLEVLGFAGLSVAMGNAKPEVKEICDLVVGDNDHDGIVDVVHRVFGL